MYSLMIFIGIVMAVVYLEIYMRHKKEPRLLTSMIEIVGMISVLFGILFANIFQNLYNFIQDPENFVWTGALTFYGGLIGGAAAFIGFYFLLIRRKFGPQMRTILTITPACITIAHGIGRIGCFCAGCCYGIETDSWLGVQLPGMDHKVYPTQLFEASFLIVLSIILLLLAIKKDCVYNMPIYLISYGIWRFLIEYIRGDYRGEFLPGLTPSQFWSIIMFLVGVGYLIFLIVRQKKAKKPGEDPQGPSSL